MAEVTKVLRGYLAHKCQSAPDDDLYAARHRSTVSSSWLIRSGCPFDCRCNPDNRLTAFPPAAPSRKPTQFAGLIRHYVAWDAVESEYMLQYELHCFFVQGELW